MGLRVMSKAPHAPQICEAPEPVEATLILLDLVNFTPQAAKAGDVKTQEFNRYIEAEIRTRAKKRSLRYIKSIGDAHLLSSEKSNTLVAFILDLFHDDRIADAHSFTVAFRLLADRDVFCFRKDGGGTVTDVEGSSQILLFRLEKLAQRDRALVTPRVFKAIQHQLAAAGILANSLPLSEPAKGLDADTPRQVHILTPPLPATLLDTTLPPPFRTARETLRAAVQFIPVFGELYPAIPMADDFLNLSLERHDTRGAGGYYRWEMPDFERRMGSGTGRKRIAPARSSKPRQTSTASARAIFSATSARASSPACRARGRRPSSAISPTVHSTRMPVPSSSLPRQSISSPRISHWWTRPSGCGRRASFKSSPRSSSSPAATRRNSTRRGSTK
jgi:hypothetical protein